MTTTYHDALALVHAGAGAIHVASFEWERVRGWCIGFARDLRLTLWVWSSSSGLKELLADNTSRVVNESLTDPIEAMKRLRDAEQGAVLLLEDVDPYLSEAHHEAIRQVRHPVEHDADGTSREVGKLPAIGARRQRHRGVSITRGAGGACSSREDASWRDATGYQG